MSQLLEKASSWASLSHADCVRGTEYQILFFYYISSTLFLVFFFFFHIYFQPLDSRRKKTQKISSHVVTRIFKKKWQLSFVLCFSFLKVKPQRGGSPKHSGSYGDDSQTWLQFYCLAGLGGWIPFPHTATPPVGIVMIKVQTLDLLFWSPALPDHILPFLRLAFMLSLHRAASLSSP